MRVVGGACKRRLLKTPARGVRPTRGSIREAIFNVLGGVVEDALVLDIFAGSGALGIEALSRGAKHCTFVEKRPRVLRANLALLGLSDRSLVLSEDFRPALRRSKGNAFDVIFCDPPYNRHHIQPTLEIIARYDLLSADGIIAAEHSPLEHYEMPENMKLWKQKNYGNTTVTFLEHGTH